MANGIGTLPPAPPRTLAVDDYVVHAIPTGRGGRFTATLEHKGRTILGIGSERNARIAITALALACMKGSPAMHALGVKILNKLDRSGI
jgi:hypothetical protein